MLDKNWTVKEFSEYYGIVSRKEFEQYGTGSAEFEQGLAELNAVKEKYSKMPYAGAHGYPYHSYVAILVMFRWLYLSQDGKYRPRSYSRLPHNLGTQRFDLDDPESTASKENYVFGEGKTEKSLQTATFDRLPKKDGQKASPRECYPVVLGVHCDPNVALHVEVEKLSDQSTVEQVIRQLWKFVKEDKRKGFQECVIETFGIELKKQG